MLLGVDGGGTKTEAVLCDTEGNVIRRVIGGPSSAVGIPFDTVKMNLSQILHDVCRMDTDLEGAIDSVYLGISGCGIPLFRERYFEYVQELLGSIPANIGSDSMNPFYGECGTSDGIVAICGTGSSAFAYKNGIIHRVDGHGYLLGDESGGYRMGQMALNAALREEDGRGPKTILTQLCRQKAGKPIMDALAEINDGGKTVIASYARCLLEARERNDGVAVRLMDGIENTMAETIIAAGNFVDAHPKKVVLCGSIWKADSRFYDRVSAKLGKDFLTVILDTPPVYGAVVKAYTQIYATGVSGDFKKNFKNTYERGSLHEIHQYAGT